MAQLPRKGRGDVQLRVHGSSNVVEVCDVLYVPDLWPTCCLWESWLIKACLWRLYGISVCWGPARHLELSLFDAMVCFA
jgi:hypothetical protein